MKSKLKMFDDVLFLICVSVSKECTCTCAQFIVWLWCFYIKGAEQCSELSGVATTTLKKQKKTKLRLIGKVFFSETKGQFDSVLKSNRRDGAKNNNKKKKNQATSFQRSLWEQEETTGFRSLPSEWPWNGTRELRGGSALSGFLGRVDDALHGCCRWGFRGIMTEAETRGDDCFPSLH